MAVLHYFRVNSTLIYSILFVFILNISHSFNVFCCSSENQKTVELEDDIKLTLNLLFTILKKITKNFKTSKTSLFLLKKFQIFQQIDAYCIMHIYLNNKGPNLMKEDVVELLITDSNSAVDLNRGFNI